LSSVSALLAIACPPPRVLPAAKFPLARSTPIRLVSAPCLKASFKCSVFSVQSPKPPALELGDAQLNTEHFTLNTLPE